MKFLFYCLGFNCICTLDKYIHGIIKTSQLHTLALPTQGGSLLKSPTISHLD